MILHPKKITLNIFKIRSHSRCLIISLLFFFSAVNTATVWAQEINFGEFSNYGVTISELNPAEDLSFGLVIQNEGLKTIDLIDSKVIMIEGVKYLDVIVDIQADNFLYLNGDTGCADSSCRMPFSLQAAYANRGTNNPNQAILMQVSSNIASAQFPILARQNLPPGPPPTPDNEGYNPALYNETVYLYIYGSLNVGNINAGSYSGTVTITVSYD